MASLARTSWDSALDRVADGFTRTIEKHGPDAVAFYLSGQLLTEDYYVANKLMKGFIGSANVDTNSRLCMASSVAGHRRAFGADTVPGIYADLDLADLIVLVGSNAAWCHPVLYQRMVANKRARGAKIVVIDPRRTATAEDADLFLPIAPGMDTALFSGLLVHLADKLALDYEYIDAHTSGFAGRAGARARDRAGHRRDREAVCGLAEADVARFFELFRATPNVVTCFSQGVNQSAQGTDKVTSHHQLPSRHRPHRQARHGAVLAHRPAQRHGRPRSRRAGQSACRAHEFHTGRDRPRRPVLARVQHGAARRPQGRADVRGDRARRDQGAVGDGDQSGGVAAARPRHARGHGASSICSSCPDNVLSNDTINSGAQILLPAAAWGEKDGTVTNSERRISRQRAFLPLPGEAMPDWWIVTQVARRMGLHGGLRLPLGSRRVSRTRRAVGVRE